MSAPKTLKESFEDLPDPRIEKKTAHKLIDIVIIAICAVISGAESWTEIEMFGQEKEEWLPANPVLGIMERVNNLK